MSNEDARVDEVSNERPRERRLVLPANIRAVRVGHGANCSSIGSVIDTLFASGVVVGAVFAAVCAAMAKEKATTVAPPQKGGDDDDGDHDETLTAASTEGGP